MNEMVIKSLEKIGNLNYYHNIERKLKNGEPIIVAFMGGSISFGKIAKVSFVERLGQLLANEIGYTLFTYHLKRKPYYTDMTDACKKPRSFTVLNYGENAVSSPWGVFRLLEVEKHKPDFIVLEYSINDRKDSFHREAFESMIRNILQWEDKCLPIILSLQSRNGYTCHGHMRCLCDNYDLPMINCGRCIAELVSNQEMDWKQFSEDEIHPNQWGHDFIAECIYYYVKTAYHESLSIPRQNVDQEIMTLPKIIFGNQYEKIESIIENVILDDKTRWIEFMTESDGLLVAFQQSREIPSASLTVYVDNNYYTSYNTFEEGTFLKPCVIYYPFVKRKSHVIRVVLDNPSNHLRIKIYNIAEIFTGNHSKN